MDVERRVEAQKSLGLSWTGHPFSIAGGVRSRIEFAEMSPAGGGKEEKCASDGRYGSTLTVTTVLSGK